MNFQINKAIAIGIDGSFDYNTSMTELLAQTVPLSLAAAIDPVLLTLTLTLLAGKYYPKGRTLAFLIGAGIVLALIAWAGILIGEGIIGGESGKAATKGIIDLIFGALLFYLGISSLLEKKREPEAGEAELAEKQVQKKGLAKWFITGIIVNITNIDALVLYLTASKEIGHSDIMSGEKILVAVISGLIVLAPVVVPLFLSIVIPRTAEKVLTPIGKFMTRYGAYIVSTIFFLFAVMILYRGLKIFI